MPTPTIPLFQQCTKCAKTLPSTDEYFHKNKARSNGLCAICKECAKAKSRQWRDDNLERARQASRDYAASHRESARERARRWHSENIERHQECARQRYQAKKPMLAEQNKQWAKNNPDKVKAIKQRYVDNHRDTKRASASRYGRSEKGAAARMRRRTNEKNAEGSYTQADIQEMYLDQGGHCGYCGITLHDEYDLDHMIPLSRGGSNWPSNLLLVCPTCNANKGTKTPQEWEAVRGW